jgi:MFS family permease
MTTTTEPTMLARLRGNPWAVLAVLSLAYFLTQLDVAVLAVAVPSIMADINASADQVVWSLSAYIFLLAMALITAGRLGDLYGRRRIFLIGVAIFTVASVAAGLAQGPGQLIAARAVQGLGAALLTPQTLALLMEAFPPDQRGMAFGIRGAVGGVAAISGPAAGGVLVSTLDWRWIFWLNVPLGSPTGSAADSTYPGCCWPRRRCSVWRSASARASGTAGTPASGRRSACPVCSWRLSWPSNGAARPTNHWCRSPFSGGATSR